MALNSVLFAMRIDAGAESQANAWLERLVSIYRPLDPTLEERTAFNSLRLVVGRVAFGRLPGDAVALTVRDGDALLLGWGGPVPSSCCIPREVLKADPARLRELDRTALLVAADQHRAVIAGAAAGPVTLYRSKGPGVTAWASHALAAAVLSGGSARIDWSALPELLATGTLGGTDTLFDSVEALPSATRVLATPETVCEETYWPAAERWARIPEDEALSVACDELPASLDRRLEDTGVPHCALTAGIDSRVIAAALSRIGSFEAFTMGDAGWPDAQGAQQVARALGARHAIHRHEPVGEAEHRPIIERAALWSDGLDRVQGFARPVVPEGITAIVTGNGGELARARYYRLAANNYRNPSTRDLLRVLGDHHRRIGRARRGAHEELDRRLKRRLEEAAESGHSGWRLLDVLHAEYKTRRFVRGRLARNGSFVLAGFSSPRLAQALVSLPLEHRLTDGFHAAFLASVAPQLPGPPARPRQRRGVPRPLRRAAYRLRSRRPIAAGRFFLADAWSEAPTVEQWVREAVIGHPRVAEVMGTKWTDATRTGFVEGEAHASRLALQLAGVVAVEEAVAGRG